MNEITVLLSLITDLKLQQKALEERVKFLQTEALRVSDLPMPFSDRDGVVLYKSSRPNDTVVRDSPDLYARIGHENFLQAAAVSVPALRRRLGDGGVENLVKEGFIEIREPSVFLAVRSAKKKN